MSRPTGRHSLFLMLFNARLKSVIRRITPFRKFSEQRRLFTNVPGNFAALAFVVPTGQGPQMWLSLRRGWHQGEYVYSYLHIAVPEKTGKRKAFRMACLQAEHLARLRYRFQPF
ncbi:MULTISPECIES: hypothetical protein [Erwinia]|uniref:Transposase n=1 Tax=Erwinia papayae TaxID=206499 RepID=A0ABV3N6Y2_9GAMM|nr:hypothetical protein [Erwinia mallotivora]